MKRSCSFLMILIFIISTLFSFSSCEQPQEEQSISTNYEDSNNANNSFENKTLRVYKNDAHTFALWDYDKEKQTMILLFDENKVIISHYVFEEMNSNETITFFNGSDKDYNWRIQLSYDNIEGTYTLFFGDDDNKLIYGNEDYSGEYYFLEEKEISINKELLKNPLDFEVVEREKEEANSNKFESRANGIWHYTISKIDNDNIGIVKLLIVTPFIL